MSECPGCGLTCDPHEFPERSLKCWRCKKNYQYAIKGPDKLDEKTLGRIKEMLVDGLPKTQIARETGVKYHALIKWISRGKIVAQPLKPAQTTAKTE